MELSTPLSKKFQAVVGQGDGGLMLILEKRIGWIIDSDILKSRDNRVNPI